MADMLKRSLASLTPEAWEEIDETAVRVLKSQLSARTLVDFDGPHGWEFAAVNLGRLDVPKSNKKPDIPWGLRQVLPLVELRVPFSLNQWELDNITRGAADADMSAVEDVARKVALFEENAIYKGFANGQIEGMIPASAHKPVRLPSNARQIASAVADGVKAIRTAGVAGPYALVLGTDAYYTLMQAGEGGFPPRRIVSDLLGGEILWSPAVSGGVLLSTRGGDFQLTVGQDLSVGYATHDHEKVELFMTESFTFRVLEPAAVVELRPAK